MVIKIKTKKWKANLETDIEEFCYKEGIFPCKRGNGILNDIGSIFGQLYYEKKATKMKDLISISKNEILEYGNFYGKPKKAEECYKKMNSILKGHGFRIYVKPRIYD